MAEEMVNEVIQPVLSLETLEDMDAPTATQALETPEADEFRLKQFSEEEMKQITDFSEKINLHDSNLIVTYGAGAQKRLADFSESALEHVRDKDLDVIGDTISDLIADLKADPTEGKGLKALFNRGANQAEKIKAHYSKVESNIEVITRELEKHQETLLKDVAIQERLFENNKAYFKELTMYIAAGRLALDKAYNEELPALRAKAAESGLAEDAQEANDFASMCERFEKKLYDLDLTRAICLQNAPQIRLVQTNAVVLSDKINSTLVNTLPLWKNQMVIALGMAHSKEAIKAQQMVSNTTNEILKKNAEMLHTSTVEIATENERGIVDLETLQHTNEELIATLDDLIRIQDEGRAKRREAEQELTNIENQLKERLAQAGSMKV
ncbi:MAG: toxic anion resistance protein [Bacillota bacterium]